MVDCGKKSDLALAETPSERLHSYIVTPEYFNHLCRLLSLTGLTVLDREFIRRDRLGKAQGRGMAMAMANHVGLGLGRRAQMN